MPANTTAIPPRKEPTGQTQLPCKPLIPLLNVLHMLTRLQYHG